MPKVYLIDDPALNAFATGRDPQHAVVAVTSGLLEHLEENEPEGVLAHELSHVGNYDIRFMAIVTALAAVVAVFSDLLLRIGFWGRGENRNPYLLVIGIAGAILAPLAAAIIQFAVSRQREYLADASGALLTRYPEGLASALHKISHGHAMRKANSATAPLYISNPLKGKSLARLFDTHPPMEERIKRLHDMKGQF
jgi:heat shock protein HtpX